MHIGNIAALWRYPVKSLRREALERAEVLADGIAGDRAAALLVETPDHARAGKPYRGKEHSLLHTLAAPEAAVAVAREAGVDVALMEGGRHFDARPISLIFDVWLREVEALVGRELDPQRYRPNIFAVASDAFAQREPDLVGARIAVGKVRLDVRSPIRRCVTTTYDVTTGQSDAAVLRAVANDRDNVVGVYCTIAHTGTIARGDALERL